MNTLTLGERQENLHDWMLRKDGLCFFRVPVTGQDTATLAAVLLQFPEHRFETKGNFLGVFQA